MQKDFYNKKIRLNDSQIEAIISAFKFCFLPSDHLWIFGSRIDMQAKGGDIDLYVETTDADTNRVIERKFKMVSKLWRSIGEQKIDVVLNILPLQHHIEIFKIARNNGIQLV